MLFTYRKRFGVVTVTVTKMDASLRAEIKKLISEVIKSEINGKITTITKNVKQIEDKIITIEKSQQVISNKFDEITKSWASNKKQTEPRIKALEEKNTNLQDSLKSTRESLYKLHCEIDEVEQYIRRDCLEFVGIPTVTVDNPKELVKELSHELNVQLEEDDLSTVHRLPDTKSTKNRIIAKFVRRDKKNELYNARKNLKNKTANSIPSIRSDPNVQEKHGKVYINESLTPYRKKLFGKICQYKKQHKFKYIWTTNGKIYLKKDDQWHTHTFTTMEEFDAFNTVNSSSG